ncbi:hypothetical protein GLOIN_2v1775064 [Rhizophagus clarus]|uniref:Uncharacterized protein n=1 Tax=Rhizophagus clarus TaxID=94130 RepID=A0A8H3KUT9_9GLOM|nr:hypothetical protein GLOIN_2v1775064 [Rhizophagus clarus]
MNINVEIFDSRSEGNEPINESFDSSDKENKVYLTITTQRLNEVVLESELLVRRSQIKYIGRKVRKPGFICPIFTEEYKEAAERTG